MQQHEEYYTVRGNRVYLAEWYKGDTILKNVAMDCKDAKEAEKQAGILNDKLRNKGEKAEKFADGK